MVVFRFLFHLGQHRVEAGRANPVAELRVRVLGDVGLHLLPVVLVAPDPLAIGADRQKPAQLFDLRQRVLQLGHPFGKPILQRQDADANVHARAQFVGIERLHEVVVRTGSKTCDDVGRIVAGGQHDDVHMLVLRVLPDAAAQFEPVGARHHPVEDGHRHALVLDQAPRFFTVPCHDRLQVPALERTSQHRGARPIVVGD